MGRGPGVGTWQSEYDLGYILRKLEYSHMGLGFRVEGLGYSHMGLGFVVIWGLVVAYLRNP